MNTKIRYVGEKEALALCREWSRVGARKLRQWRADVPGLYVKFPNYQRGRYSVTVLRRVLGEQKP